MAVEEDPVAVAAAEVAAEVVVEVAVNKRRKKFKSRRVRRVRISDVRSRSRSGCGGWLVDGLLGCVANLCFGLPVLYFFFIFLFVGLAHLRGAVPLVVAACVSGGLFYLGVKLHGKTSGNFYGGGGSCSGGAGGCSGGDGGGCGGCGGGGD